MQPEIWLAALIQAWTSLLQAHVSTTAREGDRNKLIATFAYKATGCDESAPTCGLFEDFIAECWTERSPILGPRYGGGRSQHRGWKTIPAASGTQLLHVGRPEGK